MTQHQVGYRVTFAEDRVVDGLRELLERFEVVGALDVMSASEHVAIRGRHHTVDHVRVVDGREPAGPGR